MSRSLFVFALPSGATSFVLAWDEAHARDIMRRNFCKECKGWAESPRLDVVGGVP